MKKIFQWLTGGVVKEIGNAIDKLTTTEEEKLIIKKQVQEILEKADTEAQIQVSDRWKSDMQFDGNIGGFIVDDQYIPIFQSLLITVYGAYFVGRTWEKFKQSGNK